MQKDLDPIDHGERKLTNFKNETLFKTAIGIQMLCVKTKCKFRTHYSQIVLHNMGICAIDFKKWGFALVLSSRALVSRGRLRTVTYYSKTERKGRKRSGTVRDRERGRGEGY